MWRSGRADIKAGKVDADPVPTSTSLRWGVSVVAYVNSPVAEGLTALADECRTLCGNRHTFYDRSNLHLTVRSCEFHRIGVQKSDLAVCTYLDIVADVCRKSSPFEIAYCGLNANRTGIVSQGYPLTEALQTLRAELHNRFVEQGLSHGPEAEKVRRTAHTSIVVFGGLIADAAELYRWVEANREWYGVGEITHLSVVKYNRSAYDVELVPFGNFALGG